MFRFRIGRIPVEVHLSHVLITALIAWSSTGASEGSTSWPDSILKSPGSADYDVTFATTVAIWIAIITGSVLFHELGHALASLAFGYRPSIHLVGLGGITQPNAREEIPWLKDAVITLAGPLFGLSLGVVSGVIAAFLKPDAQVAHYIFSSLFFANMFWALMNLMPVTPLDGGRLSQIFLMRIFGRPGFVVAQVVAILFALLLVLFGLWASMPIFTILFGMNAVRAFMLIQAYRRGEVPAGSAAHPLFADLAAAEAQFNEGKLTEAAEGARKVLDNPAAPAAVKGRAHYLLGWVSLKVGKGQLALEHFQQAAGVPVPPHALAEAYSLLGDEPRALALWEQAAMRIAAPAIRLGLAAALIRADRENDARKIPEVRLAAAYDEAARIFESRNEFSRAAAAAEGAFQAEPGLNTALQAARYWSRANEVNSTLRMLALAVQNGLTDITSIENDSAFSTLKAAPAFDAWLTAFKARTAAN